MLVAARTMLNHERKTAVRGVHEVGSKDYLREFARESASSRFNQRTQAVIAKGNK